MQVRPALVLGSGHLASEVCRELTEAGQPFRFVSSQDFIDKKHTAKDESSVLFIESALKTLGVDREKFSSVFIADSEDRMNVNILMAVMSFGLSIPIGVSLLNKNIVWNDLRPLPENVRIVNPSVTSIGTFIDLLGAPPTDAERNAPKTNGHLHGNPYLRRFPFVTAFLVCCYIAGSMVFFRYTENISWSASAYYVATILTGSGVGETPTLNGAWHAQFGRTAVVIVGYGITVIGIGLVIAFVVQRHREATEFGRKHHRVRNHVIIAGLGKFGFHVATELIRRGTNVVVIERDRDNPFLWALRQAYGKKARVFIGKANIREDLVDAGIGHARGLISAVNDDLVNVEIALTAFRARPNLRIVLRIYDGTFSERVREHLGFRFAVNTSRLGARALIASVAACAKENAGHS